MTLEEAYKDDPILLKLYQEKLLIRGWAGNLNDLEREYIRRTDPLRYEAQVLRMQKMRAEYPTQAKV